MSVAEIERLMGAARKLRYRVFVLTTYSMGLRLGETLALQVGDIDADRHQVHIRRGFSPEQIDKSAHPAQVAGNACANQALAFHTSIFSICMSAMV
ncbi:MAG: tyrosine-type recombinase/integrase [Xanthomonadaceae bacterium]|nr:tyrosine-type recombinase/integrase [Xanthomonadaceae bacterium]